MFITQKAIRMQDFTSNFSIFWDGMPPDPPSNAYGSTTCALTSKRQKGLAQFFLIAQGQGLV